MKNNVLILSREFAKSNNACGICMLNLANEFIGQGCSVTVLSLCSSPQESLYSLNGINVIELKENWFTTLNTQAKKESGLLKKILFRIIKAVRLPIALMLYPRVSRKQERILLIESEKIINNHDVGIVLGSFSPCETTYVPISLKRKFPQLVVYNYHLDPMLIPDNGSALINSYKFKRGKAFVNKELSKIDGLLAPDSTKGIINHPRIRYVGFPLFFDELPIVDSGYRKDNNEISIVYVGTLDKNNRNIKYTLNILEKLNSSSNKTIKLHIWGALLDHDTIEDIESSQIVKYHNTIENKYVPDLINKADFLLNISNKVSYNAIPSKIFQLFSSKKPIINIVRHPNDYAQRYFESYPAVMSIPEYENFDDIDAVVSFINNNINVKVKLPNDAFLTCRPSYICHTILSENE